MNYFIKIVFILGVFFSFCMTACAYEKIENQEEKYFIYLPKAIGDNPSKVLVVFHSSKMSFKEEAQRWEFNAEKKKFIIIGFDIDYKGIKNDADIENIYNKIEKAIGELNTKYNIEVDKVYTVGTSLGGLFAIDLLLRYPDSFYACVSVSGNKLFSGSERYIGNAKEKKFYFFHGDDDKYIPIEEAYIAEKELKKNGGIVEMFIFKNGGHTLTSDAYYKAITELSNIN